MAELTQGDRLQPSLLDRLRDDDPDRRGRAAQKSEAGSSPGGPQRSRRTREAQHIISSRELRECVKRDLAWLLNSGRLEDAVDLSRHPNVASSVLNYGMPDLTGMVASKVDIQSLEKKLIDVILNFEPRILKRSLQVRVAASEEMNRNALKFEIECDVWGQPAPERMYLHSEVDLEDGNFHFQAQGD